MADAPHKPEAIIYERLFWGKIQGPCKEVQDQCESFQSSLPSRLTFIIFEVERSVWSLKTQRLRSPIPLILFEQNGLFLQPELFPESGSRKIWRAEVFVEVVQEWPAPQARMLIKEAAIALEVLLEQQREAALLKIDLFYLHSL